jgi:uncharacterized protein (UPF0147 family)
MLTAAPPANATEPPIEPAAAAIPVHNATCAAMFEDIRPDVNIETRRPTPTRVIFWKCMSKLKSNSAKGKGN